MEKRQITLTDGRYLIFYTFEDEPVAAPVKEQREVTGGEPEVKAEAEEERGV